MNTKMPYMPTFLSWFDLLDNLPPHSSYKIIKSLVLYATEDISPCNLSEVELMAYLSCKKDVANSKSHYLARVKKNRENGKKGGLAKAARTAIREGIINPVEVDLGEGGVQMTLSIKRNNKD